MNNNDFLITTLSKNKNIHGYFTSIKNSVTALKNSHRMNIIAATIFSRAMVGTTLLSGNLKNQPDYLSTAWNCTGLVKKIYTEATYQGIIRGFIEEPNPAFIEGSVYEGSIKAEPYIGFGEIIISRNSFDNRPPYNSVVVIETGEIAQDISIYLDQGLQIQSALKIGFSANKENEIEACGGLLLMAMPGADEYELNDVYHAFESLGSLTDILLEEDAKVNSMFNKLGLEIVNSKAIKFGCRCNEENIIEILKSLGKDEIQRFIIDDKNVEVECQYCGRKYVVDRNRIIN